MQHDPEVNTGSPQTTEPGTTPAPKPDAGERTETLRAGRRVLLGALVAALLAVSSFLAWQHLRSYEETDDAEISGHLNAVTARVPGTLSALDADENQFVKAGEPLAEIDTSDYAAAVNQAKAEVAVARARVEAERPNVELTQISNRSKIGTANVEVTNATAALTAAQLAQQVALAKLHEEEATNVRSKDALDRYQQLMDAHLITRERYQEAVSDAAVRAAVVEAQQSSVNAAQERIGQCREIIKAATERADEAQESAPHQLALSKASIAQSEASAAEAKTHLDKAALDLRRTTLFSPVSGVVTKRTAEVGRHLSAGQEIFWIAQADDIWVTANFKETQLARMRVGQKARVHVDAFDVDLVGYVESLPGATGSVSSVLPPENATGSYIKVVQRLPVRVRLKSGQAELSDLRPGMSVECRVFARAL